ncbi:SIS domain-containing protein [Streptomyces canus]|uniref:SIS domain-containing protein n=1 Tax=Streptomyces canus TaxID=58343 RepID=UPI003400803D
MPGQRITFRQGQEAQPEALERVVTHVSRQLSRIGVLRTLRRPLFTGIGASYAALALPVEELRLKGVDTHRVIADEITRAPGSFTTDALISVSQSGRSAETLAAVAALHSVPTLAVVNVADSPLAESADLCIDLGDEPDSFASTVGFTSTLIALDLIARAVHGGTTTHQPWAGIATMTANARGAAIAALGSIAEQAAQRNAADVVASGASRAVAEETALLLREVARMPATASPTRHHLHGEMESAGHTLHLVYGDDREHELAHTLADAGHLTLLITSRPVVPRAQLAVVQLPEVPAAVRVVLESVVAQEVAAGVADAKDLPIESFVFANNDIKDGGFSPDDFALRTSPPEDAA